MNIEQRLERIEKSLERLNTKLTNFMLKQRRPLWVKATVITSVTGWNKYGLRDARDYGYIHFEERQQDGVRSLWYDLNSLDERFIKDQFKPVP